MDKVPLIRMRYVDPVVVCKVCILLCKTEDEFFQNHLKTLTTGGAYFHLSDSADAAAEYLCKLSTDHRQILISQDHLPIAMRHILEVKTLHGEEARLAAGTGGGEEVEGGGRKRRSGSNPKNISLELTYKSGGLEHKLVLSPAMSHARKQGAEWLKSLKKALIMLHNTHKREA
jgi:hypothetical protein